MWPWIKKSQSWIWTNGGTNLENILSYELNSWMFLKKPIKCPFSQVTLPRSWGYCNSWFRMFFLSCPMIFIWHKECLSWKFYKREAFGSYRDRVYKSCVAFIPNRNFGRSYTTSFSEDVCTYMKISYYRSKRKRDTID